MLYNTAMYIYAAREFRFNLLTPYTAELYAASAPSTLSTRIT